MEGIIIGKDRIPVIMEQIDNLKDHFSGDNLDQATTFVQNNKHNQVTSTYYLLMKKRERQTHKNYVFEQVTFDKRKQLYSTNNILTNENNDHELSSGANQKYSQSETRTKFDSGSEEPSSRKMQEQIRFSNTVKAQSMPRANEIVRTQFSNLTNHKDSIKSDDHPTAFGAARHVKQRTSPLPNSSAFQQNSEPSSIRHTGFNLSNKGQDKPETASDFAVPDIKPSYKHQTNAHMNTTFNTQLFSLRN